jgi:tetratricopeptide (TPR) repeat protein
MLWAIVALGALVGCSAAVSPEGAAALRAGNSAYLRGDDRATVESASRFLELHPRAEEAGEAYYLRGLARLRLGQAGSGREDLLAAIQATRREDLKALANLALGNLAFEAGDLTEAEDRYRACLGGLAMGAPPADQAMYRLGCVLQRGGRWLEADRMFNRQMHLFEGMRLSGRAAERAQARQWSVQAGAFAEPAAAERLRGALRAADMPARIDLELRDGRPMHLVRVGAFPDYTSALAMLAKVRGRQAGAYLVPAR